MRAKDHKKHSNHWILLVSAGVYFGLTPNAYAYLDPNLGSHFLKLILIAVLGGFLTMQVFWRRLFELFQKLGGFGKRQSGRKRRSSQ